MEETEYMKRDKGCLKKILLENKTAQVVFFVVSMAMLMGLYFPIKHHVEAFLEKNKILSKPLSVEYDVWFAINCEKVNSQSTRLSGWIIKKDTYISKTQIVLLDESGQDLLVYPITYCEDNGLALNFIQNQEDKKRFFYIDIPLDELNRDTSYELQFVLCYGENDSKNDITKKISANQYLYNGKLFNYNPTGYKEPLISDKELLDVIEDGRLLLYDFEYQLWIYQYGKTIVYFTEPGFGSMTKAKIGIPIVSRTNLPELLPENSYKQDADHLGFHYENIYFQKDGVLPYQVVVVELSEEYPITYLTTGFYDSAKEQWIKKFDIPYMGWVD